MSISYPVSKARLPMHSRSIVFATNGKGRLLVDRSGAGDYDDELDEDEFHRDFATHSSACNLSLWLRDMAEVGRNDVQCTT